MRQELRVPLFLIAAVLAVPAVLPAASSTAKPHVTIRGSGNAISIERAEPSAPGSEAGEAPLTVLDEAIRMKASGATDDALVGFFRAHREALPSVVDLDAVSALRDAGAGHAVIAYLASVAAVEMGPTGAEGRSEEPEGYSGPPPESSMSNELPADLAWGGWGWGWGGIANGDFGHSRHHGFGHGRGMDRGFGNRGFGRGTAPRPTPLPAGRTPAPASQQSVRTLFPRR